MGIEMVLVYAGFVIAGLLAVQGLAMQVVKRTETPMDDNIVGKVYKVVEFVAGVLPEKYKRTIAMPRGGENKEV